MNVRHFAHIQITMGSLARRGNAAGFFAFNGRQGGGMSISDAAKGWQIDRHVPVAVVLALVLQTAGMVWWAATLDSRVGAIEAQQARAEGVTERIARMEARQELIYGELRRIGERIDKQGR